jgi:putative addiction module component (TIGR02574 family)
MSLASIRNEIEKLEPAERASLIDLLWNSLDDDSVQQIEAKWAAESEDRIDAFERGELTAVDGPSALEELRSSYRFTSPVLFELQDSASGRLPESTLSKRFPHLKARL